MIDGVKFFWGWEVAKRDDSYLGSASECQRENRISDSGRDDFIGVCQEPGRRRDYAGFLDEGGH